MVNSVSVQTLEFLYSALFGVCLGVLFDIIRLFRFYMPSKKALTALFDLLFWIIAIISLFAFILTVCGGKMRWYVLVGVFCACFVYMAALSEIVYKTLSALVASIRKVLSLITYPMYLLMGWIWRRLKKTERKAEATIKRNVKKRMKKRKAGKNGSKKAQKAQELIS